LSGLSAYSLSGGHLQIARLKLRKRQRKLVIKKRKLKRTRS
jgi:hypothetical protein